MSERFPCGVLGHMYRSLQTGCRWSIADGRLTCEHTAPPESGHSPCLSLFASSCISLPDRLYIRPEQKGQDGRISNGTAIEGFGPVNQPRNRVLSGSGAL